MTAILSEPGDGLGLFGGRKRVRDNPGQGIHEGRILRMFLGNGKAFGHILFRERIFLPVYLFALVGSLGCADCPPVLLQGVLILFHNSLEFPSWTGWLGWARSLTGIILNRHKQLRDKN